MEVLHVSVLYYTENIEDGTECRHLQKNHER